MLNFNSSFQGAKLYDSSKGPFGTALAFDSKRASGGAMPNGYFLIDSRVELKDWESFFEER